MSSDGSVDSTGSRLRQFGLYRSIDARTEEFLRLSRRRQLRQGCACAAISTAVTVTIVICVIFVYEFIVISERSKNMSRKWYNLMNSSSDPQIFDPKLNDKMHRDSSTVKLLPILLKRLRENVYKDTIRDDFNINSDATEPYIENIFSDIRNGVKMSSPRHHIKDYKSSPFTYLKKPGRDIEDYKKITQTGDYKRIIKFLGKPFEFSLSVIKSIPDLMADKKVPNNKTSVANQKIIESNRKINTTRYSDCKCRNSMRKFLNQIITCLQKNVSEFQEASYNHFRATKNMTRKSIISPTTSKIITSPNNLLERTSTVRCFKINSALPQNISRSKKKYRNESLLSILNILRPKDFNLNTKEVNLSNTAPKTVILLPAVNKVANVSNKLFIKHTDMKTTTELYKPTEQSEDENILKNNINVFSYIFYNTSQDEVRGRNITKKVSNDDKLEEVEKSSKHKTQHLKGKTLYKIKNEVPYFKKFLLNNTPKYTKPNLSAPSKLLTISILQKPYKKTDRWTILKPKNTDSTSPNIHIEDNFSTIFNSIDQITDFDWSLEEDDIEKIGVDKIYKGVENATEISISRENLDALNFEVGFDNVADDNHSRQLIHAGRPSYLEIRRNTWKKGEKRL